MKYIIHSPDFSLLLAPPPFAPPEEAGGDETAAAAARSARNLSNSELVKEAVPPDVAAAPAPPLIGCFFGTK